MNNRIGLLGGTFNPIHKGHIELGLQIYKAFQLEKILYILSAYPPHKKDYPVAPTKLRWEMLKKALGPFPHLEPCDIEMKRSTWSWTNDTINELKRKNPETEFYFISGSEGFLRIRTWKNYKNLLKALSFVVVLRKPGHLPDIKKLLGQENITPSFDYSNQSRAPEIPAVFIFSYKSEKINISSTLIRERIKSSKPIVGLVDKEVKEIMEENKLYGRK